MEGAGGDEEEMHEQGPLRIRWVVKEPSARERETHISSGHIPYRSWCRACIAGRGRQDPHKRDKTEKAA
eukprot:901944-Amphidinium_carterae.1